MTHRLETAHCAHTNDSCGRVPMRTPHLHIMLPRGYMLWACCGLPAVPIHHTMFRTHTDAGLPSCTTQHSVTCLPGPARFGPCIPPCRLSSKTLFPATCRFPICTSPSLPPWPQRRVQAYKIIHSSSPAPWALLLLHCSPPCIVFLRHSAHNSGLHTITSSWLFHTKASAASMPAPPLRMSRLLHPAAASCTLRFPGTSP